MQGLNKTKTRVVMIGAGNVAHHLVRALHQAGFCILQVYSRTETSAKTLADEVQASYTTNVDSIDSTAHWYVFCVVDDALPMLIASVCGRIKTEAVFVHTAGSVSQNIFAPYVQHYGVLYPLQTFSKKKAIAFQEVPLLVDASQEETLQTLCGWAQEISSKVQIINETQRYRLHLAAVFACNFTNACVDMAYQVVTKIGLPFDLLLPLISETMDKLHTMAPSEAQTGPAKRHDKTVMEKHLQWLSEDRDMQEIYRCISAYITKRNNKKTRI